MNSNDEKKYLLQEEAMEIGNGAKEQRLLDRSKSRPIQELVEFLLKDPNGGKSIRVAGYIKFLQGIPNPRTGTYFPGEIWYRGNLTIMPDPLKGYCGETRSFVYEVLSQKGIMGKRGRFFQVITTVKEEKNNDEFEFFRDFFKLKNNS